MKWFMRFRRIPVFALLFLVFNFLVYFLIIFLSDSTALTDIDAIKKILGWCWTVNLSVTIVWTVLTPVILIVCCISGFILYARLSGQHAFEDRSAKKKALIPFICYLILIILLIAFGWVFLSELVRM